MEDDEKNAYFESARAIGGTAWHTLRRHVWSNITAPVIVVFSITIGGIIIAYATTRLRALDGWRGCGMMAAPGVGQTQ